MILDGYVRNKQSEPIANAMVEIKGEDFITIHSTESNEDGYYRFDIPSGHYPFLIAVKDYAVNCLEYWSQNILLENNMSLDVSFDTLEIYGLHVFKVKGGGNSLMVYFRPMSLVRFQQGETDIAPVDFMIKVVIDGKEYPVIHTNLVKEIGGEQEMSAYLIQVDTFERNMQWNKFEIQIMDKEGNFGAASIFNENG